MRCQNLSVCSLISVLSALADGRHLIIEMRNQTCVNFAGRALYYVSRRIVVQGKKGEWQYEYAPVFGVYFLNYKEATLGRSFRTDFSIDKKREFFVSENVRAEHELLMSNGVETPLTDKMRMIFIQLPEFTKTASECENDFERWLYIMNHTKELDSIPWKDQNPIWSELADVCSTAALTPAELFAYEEELRKQWDLEATFLAKEE
ncbi:MAG: PD-(D/E)XK nuclease family transposase, partial [Proteobacteria bacterium]|nr:PD-(D/E)XK nuclease family transposase [Pseudomonadota bacterium]